MFHILVLFFLQQYMVSTNIT